MKSSMKRLVAGSLCSILALTMMGCGNTSTEMSNGSASAEASSGEKKVVGIAGYDESNENCITLDQSIKTNLEGKGYEVILVDGQADLQTQMDQIDNFIVQDVDAIVSMFIDPAGIGPSVTAANEAEIPVFGMTTVSEEGDYYFIGSNEYDMGAMQAEILAEQIPEDGKVLYLMNKLGQDSQVKRAAGFKETLAKLCPNVKILAEQEGITVEGAMSVMEDWISAYPDFDAVVAQTDLGILGAIQALKAANIDGVITLSIDGTADAKAAIEAGDLYATIAQDWVGMGELCADMIDGLLNGEEYEQETVIEGYAITAENVANYQ
ncbi:MAG: sugar ABC transporter substrate-binding protein [Eubacteriales bacterium]|nr:sugar ABC transporter substrate-binding protein [Eubacteriales bacterium]